MPRNAGLLERGAALATEAADPIAAATAIAIQGRDGRGAGTAVNLPDRSRQS
jgi:hypothetical protein